MSSETTPDIEGFQQAVAFIDGLTCPADGKVADRLVDFSRLLTDLLQIYQDLEDEDVGGASSLAEMITRGATELQSALECESPNFDSLDSINDQAIDFWGEQLWLVREQPAGFDGATWELPGDGQSEDSDEETISESSLLASPSADAIEALLNQLGTNSSAALTHSSSSDQMDRDERAADPQDEAQVAQRTADRSLESLEPELLEAFLDDARGCLTAMEASLLRLESNPQDHQSINQILRELHTLKGASGSVGLLSLAADIHGLEDRLRDQQQAGQSPSVDELLRDVDRLRGQLSPKGEPLSNHQAPQTESTLATSLSLESSAVEDAAGDEMVRVRSSQLNRLMDMLAELVMLRNQRETELSALQGVYDELIFSVSNIRLLSNEGDSNLDSTRSLQLSEVASDVLEAAQSLRDCIRPFTEGNAAVSSFIRQFRQELVGLRRTPISGLFRRLQRVARDAARSESKQVRLELIGEDAGIERALQQRLYEPLLHIVRNCVGHGIESPDSRIENGKPAEGVISLEAKSGPDLFTIEIRDDGRGLDYEAIRRRGVERHLLAADNSASRDELAALIFEPGFSTRESANQVGGRGVGMDVVATTLKKMRGWLSVQSQPGSGTTIRLSFPLPSVIQHAMVFRCGGQQFAIPMESVQATGKTSGEIPRTSLAALLGLPSDSEADKKPMEIVVEATSPGPSGGPQSVALLVDEVVGPEELVVRPLPTLIRNHPCCVGATLAGLGQTVVLLDVRRALELRGQLPNENSSELKPSSSTDSQRSGQALHVLVVDDSLSARKRVARSLARYPLEITEANDGREALEYMKHKQFAAVFSDLEMPHLDGLELLAELQKWDPERTPPIVIISSRSENSFTDRARDLGASDYLIKPLADESLDSTLSQLAPLRHLVTEEPLNQPEKSS